MEEEKRVKEKVGLYTITNPDPSTDTIRLEGGCREREAS